MNSGLEIRNIQKRFSSQTALSSINLQIQKGEFFSLLGPSGCGKSTLLRILAGLETADQGEIYWDGKRIDAIPARERPFNMVFQKYALFPHLTVFENVAFGMRLKKVNGTELRNRVMEALELVNLSGFLDRLPETLSGGQAQRVALARALVNRPACVLLDEPLTALDQKLREHMRTELRLLQKRLGLTFIFVTHDQEEAMLLSDRVAVMDLGRIEQVAEPRELYELPQSIFAARFIGSRNEIPLSAVTLDGDWMNMEAEFSGQKIKWRGKFRGGSPGLNGNPGVAARAFVCPERLSVCQLDALPNQGYNSLEGKVIQLRFRGIHAEAIVQVGGSTHLRVLVDSSRPAFVVNESVRIEFSPHDAHVFYDESNQ